MNMHRSKKDIIAAWILERMIRGDGAWKLPSYVCDVHSAGQRLKIVNISCGMANIPGSHMFSWKRDGKPDFQVMSRLTDGENKKQQAMNLPEQVCRCELCMNSGASDDAMNMEHIRMFYFDFRI